MSATETEGIGADVHDVLSSEIISLALGGPMYAPPRQAQASAARVLVEGYHASRYISREGLPRLRILLAKRVSKRYAVPNDENWIAVTNGASMGLTAAILALTHPGDPVACPDPGYPGYRPLAQQLGRAALPYPAPAPEHSDEYVYDGVRRAVDSGARLILWSSPVNPTGAVASEKLTTAIAQLAHDRGLMLISDESYEDIVFDGCHHSPAVTAPEDVCAIYSFSKSFGLAGWRVGYVAAPPSVADAISHVHFSLAMSVPTLSQFAALGALTASDDYRIELVQQLRAVRDESSVILADHGVPHRPPAGGYFHWLDIRQTGLSSDEFCQRSHRISGVTLMPGSVFGRCGEGFARLNFAAMPDAVFEGCRRVGKLYRQLSEDGGLPH